MTQEAKQGYYYIGVPVQQQARFTMVAVFRESVEFVRNYTCPFNMLAICTRAEGKDASLVRNLRTGEEISSQVNQITMCPCNLPQRYHHTLRNEHLAIHFKLELFPGVDVFSGQDHVFREYSPELAQQAKEIFQIKDPVRLLSHCQEFALHFCHRHWPEHYAFELKEMQRFSEVLDFIRKHADAATGVPELAALMKMPESSFCRAFHAAFNMPPKQFLQQELFKKAAQNLLIPGVTIKEVAAKLHFSSEFYFSHFFKRQSGVSPRNYQANHHFPSRG